MDDGERLLRTLLPRLQVEQGAQPMLVASLEALAVLMTDAARVDGQK